jgi:hypothetical protein
LLQIHPTAATISRMKLLGKFRRIWWRLGRFEDDERECVCVCERERAKLW